MFGEEGREMGNGSEMGEDAQRGTANNLDDHTSSNHPTDTDADRLLDYYA
jgi:hypothetical protein